MSFEILRPVESPRPVIVHAPHGSTVVPDRLRAGLVLDDDRLALELLRMTDHHTDRLAEHLVETAGVMAFVNRASRLVVDPERFLDPSERMEQVGMGAVYVSTHDGKPLRDPSPDVRASLLAEFFDPYAEALADLVDEVLDAHGHCTIIDLHSYPSQRLPYELSTEGDRPEICLGTDEGHTPAGLAEEAAAAAASHGFSWSYDTPFDGTYVPTRHFGSDERVRSLMVEIRRDTYVDEESGEPTDGIQRIEHFLLAVAEAADALSVPQ